MNELIVSRYVRWAVSLFLGIGVFLFWNVAYPQALNYQEQNQLFLFTADYLMERISVAGGLADYVSEFIAQFYYIPWVGAVLLALLFVIIQYLVGILLSRIGRNGFIMSLVPPVLLLAYMGDIHVLLSFPVAWTFALLVTVGMGNRWKGADVCVIPLLYWLVGPAAWVYVWCRVCLVGWKWGWTVLYLLAVQLLASVSVLRQWPWESVMNGLNYYFIPKHTPAMQHVVILSVPLLLLLARWLEKMKGHRIWMWGMQLVLVSVIAFVSIGNGYDDDLHELLMQDKLVREGKWTEIIQRAEKHQVKTAFSSNCVNLALAQRRQLADRMFTFYQSGEDALIMPRMRDNMSAFPTMEVFWKLGMVNSCLRYASDLQESILNARKSGRLTRRIIECHMVNGNYPIARKHIDLLKKSLFYREWAERMETMLGNEALIDNDGVLGKVRKYRFKDDFLYNYEEIEKMMGILFVGNPENKMALDYFMGSMLLKGNVQGFGQYMSWVQQYGGYPSMPIGYQDVMKCIQAEGNVPGSPYAAYVKRMMNEKGGSR